MPRPLHPAADRSKKVGGARPAEGYGRGVRTEHLKAGAGSSENPCMKVMDKGILADLARMGGVPVVEMMLDTATAAMRASVDEILAAVEIGDFSGTAKAAHALVSSSGAVGAEAVCDAARSIQADALRGFLDPGDTHILSIRFHLEAFLAEVDALDQHDWLVPNNEVP